MTSIGPLNDDDSRIRSQLSCQLPIANVDRIHPGGTALQQAIGEPSRARTEICGDETTYVDAKGGKRKIQLVAAAAHESGRRFEGQFVAAAHTRSSSRDGRPVDEHV